MEDFGITVKELRESRGFMIKEVYTGVIGRTTAYRFERGTTTISTTNLLKILYNIGIYSMDEFLFFHQKRCKNYTYDLDKFLTQLIQSEGLKIKSNKHNKILEFYEKYRDSQKKEKKFLAYAAHYDYLTNQSENIRNKLSIRIILQEFEDEWEYVENYLLSIETWSFRELDWFPFLSSCFHKEVRPVLLRSFKHNFMKLHDFYENWESHYFNSLLNYEMNSVFMEYYDDIAENIEEIEEYYEENSELQWEIFQKSRLLYIRIILAGKENNSENVRFYYQQLVNISKVFSKENELMDFLLENSLEIVSRISTKINLEELFTDIY